MLSIAKGFFFSKRSKKCQKLNTLIKSNIVQLLVFPNFPCDLKSIIFQAPPNNSNIRDRKTEKVQPITRKPVLKLLFVLSQ